MTIKTTLAKEKGAGRNPEAELEEALSGFEDEPETEDAETETDSEDEDDDDIPTRGRISAKNGGVDSLLRRTERRMRKQMTAALTKFDEGISERRQKIVDKHEGLISAKLDEITLANSGQVKNVAAVQETLARQMAAAKAQYDKLAEQMGKLKAQAESSETEENAA